MNINFTPISMFESYSLAVSGDSIIIDGKEYALSELASNVDAEQPMPKFVVIAAADSVTLLLPYWGEASGRALFPEPIIAAPDGVVEFPR